MCMEEMNDKRYLFGCTTLNIFECLLHLCELTGSISYVSMSMVKVG